MISLSKILRCEIFPAAQFRRRDAKLRQRRHDLRAVFGGVVNRLHEQDGLWHTARRTLPVNLDMLLWPHARSGVDQRLAAGANRRLKLRQRRRGGAEGGNRSPVRMRWT